MLDQANRTFICSVVFIDLVGYSKKTVTEQIRLKTSLTNNLSEAIKDIPVNDRIILDTGDGAAISFLGDPEDALFVTLSLREAMVREGLSATMVEATDRKSTRLNSSHANISYAVFCLKKKKKIRPRSTDIRNLSLHTKALAGGRTRSSPHWLRSTHGQAS